MLMGKKKDLKKEFEELDKCNKDKDDEKSGYNALNKQFRAVQKEIDELVKNTKVVLFMKGSKMMPQCGFSAMATQILTAYTKDYTTVNVLADPLVRQGIKDYSNWPTIPQCYVDGEFIGGSDILRELHETGELETLFGSSEAS